MKIAALKIGTLAALVGLLALIIIFPTYFGRMHFLSPPLDCGTGNSSGCDAIRLIPQAPIGDHKNRRSEATNKAAGFVISSKTGARTRVGIRYAERFQAYIDDLEKNHGVRVLFMGGIRRGDCSSSSEHPCGKALDVCQLRRGVVDPRCKLPGRAALGQIAASHGLFEGGRWCNSDYGHVQVDTTPACGQARRLIARRKSAEPLAWAQNTPDLTASY